MGNFLGLYLDPTVQCCYGEHLSKFTHYVWQNISNSAQFTIVKTILQLLMILVASSSEICTILVTTKKNARSTECYVHIDDPQIATFIYLCAQKRGVPVEYSKQASDL